MAYAQWVVLHIINSFRTKNIHVRNAHCTWGKFHAQGNKDHEISATDIDKITIPAGGTSTISSCGRSDAASGTEGTLDLYDGDTKICTIYWDCPWGSKSNNFEVRDRNSAAGYMVSPGEWNHDSGALGRIEIEVAIKG